MQNRKYFPSITALRLPFILGIVLFHTHGYFGDPCSVLLGPVYRQGGSLGNIFFFMSSGFLMSIHYHSRIMQHEIPLFSYIQKRLLSLYPLYLISNLVQLALIYSSGGLPDWPLSRVFLSMLFVSEGWVSTTEPPNYPTWFICLLIWCYLLFFIVCWFSKTNNIYRIAVILLILWGYFLRGNPLTFPFCYAITGSAEMNFFIGCLISELLFSTKRTKKAYLLFESLWFIALLLFYLFNGLSKAAGDIGFMFSAVLVPGILILGSGENLLSSLCRKRAIQAISGLSMHLFFWHIPVFTLYKRIQENTGLGNALSGLHNMLLYISTLILVSIVSMVISKQVSLQYRLFKQRESI